MASSGSSLSRKDRDRKFKQVTSIFVLITMLMALGLIWLGNTEINPFGKKFDLRLELEHASGLVKNDQVTLAGMKVGKVEDMSYSPGNKIMVLFWVLDQHRNLIRQDSLVILNKGLMGSSSLDITLGSPDQPQIQANQIMTVQTGGMDEVMKQLPTKIAMLDAILSNIAIFTRQLVNPDLHFQHSLAHLESIMANAESVTNKLNNQEENFQRILTNLEKTSREAAGLTTKINQTLPSMIHNLDQSATSSIQEVEGLMKELRIMVNGLSPLTAQISEVLKSTGKIASDMSSVTGHLKDSGPEIPLLIHQSKDVMFETEITLRNLNNSILFGGSGSVVSKTRQILPDVRDVPTMAISPY